MLDNKAYAEILVKWYDSQKRPLPWRINRNPYPIWISEIMLQQTTTKAVLEYFNRFLIRFPNVEALAEAKIEDVYEQWAGLGYYSRARNLHKASQILAKDGFPKTHTELMALPGFGPYTSRAVSSQAFGEKVGVVDGNVNRVYCRVFNDSSDWWSKKTQSKIQAWADDLCQWEDPSEMNQALMELGATVCTYKSPTCLICPWNKDCQSFKLQTQNLVPKKKAKKNKEIWVWNPEVYLNSKKEFLLVEKNDVSFLKNKWVFPGKAKRVEAKPQKYDYKHTITNHEIYVSVSRLKSKSNLNANLNSAKSCFVDSKFLSQKSPFSLMKKALDFIGH